MVPGVWPTARLCSLHFRLLTSMRSVFLGCWMCSSSTELNRRMRTRMYGGVAGESRRPLPLCRFARSGTLDAVCGASTDVAMRERVVPPGLDVQPAFSAKGYFLLRTVRGLGGNA